MQNGKLILWDWNGTLLDDTHICVDAINILLRDRKKKEIGWQLYREIFTFPVRDYYTKAGFDFSEEAFEIPAMQFIEIYTETVKNARLFEGAVKALRRFEGQAHKQAILSAMEQDALVNLVKRHGIDKYFERICGIDNHYAAGKIANARKLISEIVHNRENTFLIGDTIHDHEVGEALGIKTILLSHGHQSRGRLESTGRPIVNNFEELDKYLN